MNSSTTRADLELYLISTGWQEPAQSGEAGTLWSHPSYPMRLAVPDTLTRESGDWELILSRLSTLEQRETGTIADQIAGGPFDIARLRASSDVLITDSIPYVAAVAFVRDSWQMLRSCATTSLGPKGHIRRYRNLGDDIAHKARLAHTQRGSFIFPILMPVGPFEDDAATMPDPIPGVSVASPESQERRAMRTLAEALTSFESVVVTPERQPSRSAVTDLVAAGVSHEFSKALERILAQPTVAEFSASFDWAASRSAAPSNPAREVTIPGSMLERVRQVSNQLQSDRAPRTAEVFTGPIIGAHRDDDAGGHVIVQTVRNSRSAHVTVNVSSVRLDQALDWMKLRETVVVEGRVHRSSTGLVSDRLDAVEPLRTRHLPQN